MKIAILSDIHANLAAFEAVLNDLRHWEPDAVVVAGDIVNRGPEPAACVELLLDLAEQKQWRFVRGNHEDFVISERGSLPDRSAWKSAVFQHTTWTARQLRRHLDCISEWPDQIELQSPDRQIVRIVHASMQDNRTGLYDKMCDEQLRPLITPPPHVLCVGHTHRPFVRQVDRSLVVNAGAVGLPFDRDPRASYALLDWLGHGWRAQIIRVSYDRDRAERAFERSGYSIEGGPMVRLIVDEFRHSRPNLMRWHLEYEDAVAQGFLSIEESIDHLLSARNETQVSASLR